MLGGIHKLEGGGHEITGGGMKHFFPHKFLQVVLRKVPPTLRHQTTLENDSSIGKILLYPTLKSYKEGRLSSIRSIPEKFDQDRGDGHQLLLGRIAKLGGMKNSWGDDTPLETMS